MLDLEDMSSVNGTPAHAYYFVSLHLSCSLTCNLKVVIAVPGHSEQSRVLRSKAKNAEKTSRTSFSGRAAPKPHALLFGTDKV